MSDILKDGGFEIDWSEFNRRFLEFALTTAPKAAEKGMWEALTELKDDCDKVQPKTPLRKGSLRGDFDLVLEGITESRVVSTGSKGAAKAKPAERRGASNIITKLIFRMPYAAKLHEAIRKKITWTEPGSGPKYVETKLMAFRKKYIGIVRDNVAEAFKGK